MTDAVMKVTIEINPSNDVITASQKSGITPPTPYRQEFEMNIDRDHLPIRLSVQSVEMGADNKALLEASMVCKD